MCSLSVGGGPSLVRIHRCIGEHDPAFAELLLLNTKEKIQMETLTMSGGDPFMHGPYIRK